MKQEKCLSKSASGIYTFSEDGEKLTTPGGFVCKTKSDAIAKRVLADWKKFGYAMSGNSILPWLFTYVENFKPMGAVKARQIMIQSFQSPMEWTYQCESPNPHAWMEFKGWFGEYEERWPQIEKWLRKLNAKKLTAACCVANAFQSLNIAYVFSCILEEKDSNDRKRKAALKGVSEFIEIYLGEAQGFVKQVFDLFALVWNS